MKGSSPLRSIIGGAGASSTNYKGTATWAARPGSPATNDSYFFTDVGPDGLFMYWNATRWKPFNSHAEFNLNAPVAGITNTESIAFKQLFNSALLKVGDVLQLDFTTGKSGTTDIGNGNIRFGTAGTTADTAIKAAIAVMTAAHQSGGAQLAFKIISNTTIQSVGAQGAVSTGGSYNGGNATPVPAAIAVSDISANAMYLDLGLLSAGATNTLTAYSCAITWRTP